ncbi:hypothetical protein [Mucilaginibacter sp. UYCu711]|uniref:hypothetical protein n=1 Tax=Mucilaginibacter sp. UYCu711 TaxID=3156339 RepID=UPI003D2243E6
MEINKVTKAYYEAIGEFIVVYSGLEMHLSKFLSAQQSHAHNGLFSLSVTIAANFDTFKKVEKLDTYIHFHIPSVTESLKNKWKDIYKEIKVLAEARNFLVHGLCFGFVHCEPIDTFLTINKNDKENMVTRKFMLAEIIQHTTNARAVVNSLQKDFWHEYLKVLGFQDVYLTSISLGEVSNLSRPVKTDDFDNN